MPGKASASRSLAMTACWPLSLKIGRSLRVGRLGRRRYASHLAERSWTITSENFPAMHPLLLGEFIIGDPKDEALNIS